MDRWVTMAFATVGAFFLGGIAGAAIASVLNLWELPVAGFFAAFLTVSTAFLAAPKHDRIIALVMLLIGSTLASFVLGESSYPESYLEKAYLPTYFPLIVTLLGGVLAFIITIFIGKDREANT